MEQTQTPLLPAPTPWYRTRWFWGVVVGALVIWGLTIYFTLLPSNPATNQVLASILAASGGLSFLLIGSNLLGLGTAGSVVLTGIYYILLVFLIYKTFQKSLISLTYPVLLMILFILGTTLGGFFLSGI